MSQEIYRKFSIRIYNGTEKYSALRNAILASHASGGLTDEELDQLLELQYEHMTPAGETPTLDEAIAQILTRLAALEAQVAALTGGAGDGETGSETYPAWTAWDGVSDNYQPGAVVSHNGKLWQSTYQGQNVWEPGSAGIDERYWVEVTA